MNISSVIFMKTIDSSTMIQSMTNSTVAYDSSESKSEEEVPTFQFSSQVTATVFFVFIFLLGVFGNLLVVLVVCLNRNMKTSVNIYLINLCIADILVLSVCMPTVLVDVYAQDVWYFGKIMCYMVPMLENTVVHASVLTLIAISVERYRVVCQPLRGIGENMVKSVKVVICIWIVCVISNIPWLFIAEYRDSVQTDDSPIKVCRLPVGTFWRRTFVTGLCVFYFVIPFIVLLILYCRICYILHISKHNKASNELKNSCQSRQRYRLRAQVINIITCLVVLFFVFHLPYRVISMWFTFADRHVIHELGLNKLFDIVYSARILFYFNHAVNPILYNFVSTKFRNALKVTMGRKPFPGSMVSSNRRGNNNTPLTRPQNSQVLIDDENADLIHCNHGNGTSSKSSSSRQKLNEFVPMYARILAKQCQERNVY